MNIDSAVGAAARQFETGGEFIGAAPTGNGHIHDSYCAVFDCGGAQSRFLLQRINTGIFPRTTELMENIERVTAHIDECVREEADAERRVLTLVATLDGRSLHVDEYGASWRMYRFIEGTRSVDEVESAEQCYEAARAFGLFQQQLTTLPGPRLHDTIPDFHNTPKRVAALERAIAADSAGRVRHTQPEIEFALSRVPIAATLLNAGMPERITHNDTKINNILLDERTGEAMCVIDLDTVMPGLALYDFGDLVRTAACTAAEDERDLNKVCIQFPLFEALVRGYLNSTHAFLTFEEKELLAFSAKLITYEIGVRFLTDYLQGDTYFKVHRDGHNLDRCRAQFKLAASIERQEEAMRGLVRSLG